MLLVTRGERVFFCVFLCCSIFANFLQIVMNSVLHSSRMHIAWSYFLDTGTFERNFQPGGKGENLNVLSHARTTNAKDQMPTGPFVDTLGRLINQSLSQTMRNPEGYEDIRCIVSPVVLGGRSISAPLHSAQVKVVKQGDMYLAFPIASSSATGGVAVLAVLGYAPIDFCFVSSDDPVGYVGWDPLATHNPPPPPLHRTLPLAHLFCPPQAPPGGGDGSLGARLPPLIRAERPHLCGR